MVDNGDEVEESNMHARQLRNRSIEKTLTFIQATTSFTPILALIDSPYAVCLTIFSGRSFSLFLEDKIDDTRIVLRWCNGSSSLEYSVLSHFNESLNAWTRDETQGTVEIKTRSGQAKLFKRFEDFGKQFTAAPRPKALSLYKHEENWRTIR